MSSILSLLESLRRPIFASLLIILGTVSLGACNDTPTTWQRIQDTGTIRVGVDPTYPPFESLEEGQLRGIDIDLVNAIADDLHLRVAFSYFGYDGLYDALYTEQVDLLISALVVRPEKTRDFSYSHPYFDAGQILVSRVGEEFNNLDDIEDITIAVELGSEGHTLANQWKRNKTDLVVISHKSVEEALEALVNLDADVAIVDNVSGRLFAADSPDLETGDRVITTEPYALVVRSEDNDLLNRLNDSFEKLIANGTLDHIMDQWLDGG
jgi:ABC-type amino acid transport substrate-binding protein